MPDISKITVPNGSSAVTYDIKDSRAETALVDVIDNGLKNIINAQNPSGQQRVTITNGNDGAVNISCSNAKWATTAYTVSIKPNTWYTFALYVDSATLSGVSFMYFLNASENGSDMGELSRGTITGPTVKVSTFNTQYSELKASVNINNSALSGSGSATVRLMLCPKAAYEITSKYVPYRPSYDELVARITALENT